MELTGANAAHKLLVKLTVYKEQTGSLTIANTCYSCMRLITTCSLKKNFYGRLQERARAPLTVKKQNITRFLEKKASFSVIFRRIECYCPLLEKAL
jgi:hypothetical protein